MLRRRLIIAAAIAVLIVIAIAVGLAVFFGPLLARYIQSDRFRTAMQQETAKGLHFPGARFAPIRRIGRLTAQSASFDAENGVKAMKSLQAHGITAIFDPWGVFSRHWRFDEVHVQSGQVAIQIYEAHPEATAPKAWFEIFLPNRVYLKRIEGDHADVTWQLRGEQAGFFGTQLLITPHGRDFEYGATGGKLKMALVPDLTLRRGHLLITKTAVTLYEIDLASDSGSEESIHAQANAGIGSDKSVDVRAAFNVVPIRPWLPAERKGSLTGSGFGDIHWTGKDPKLESSSGEGSLRIRGGRIDDVPLLQRLAELSQKKSFERLELNDCSFNFAWRYPEIDIKDVLIEQKGKFRVEGEIFIDHHALRGTLRLGLTRQCLDWLPNPEENFQPPGGRLSVDARPSGRYDRAPQSGSQSAHYRTIQGIARRVPWPAVSPVRRLAKNGVRRRSLTSEFRALISRFARFQHANPLLYVWKANRQRNAFALPALDG